MKEEIQYAFRNTAAKLLTEKGYKLRMSAESKSRIDYVKEMLEDRTELSFMDYFNHICFADPLFAGYIATLIDPRASRKLIAPISYSHTEKKIKNIGTLGMRLLAETGGVETHRVIQSYQIDNPNYGYTKEMAIATNKPFFNRLKELSKEGTSVGCMICPEGHRSETGILERGEEGVVLIDKLIQPVVNIPLGVSFENGYKRSNLNFGKELLLTVGEPKIYEAKSKRVSFDEIMTDLAKTLPMGMRGEWGEKII